MHTHTDVHTETILRNWVRVGLQWVACAWFKKIIGLSLGHVFGEL